MPPGKGGNAKKESGRAKKAENEAKKQEAAAAQKVRIQALFTTFSTQKRYTDIIQERTEAEKWQDGSKSNKNDKEEKRKAELARKAENARLLAEEESSTKSKPKPAPKAGAKKAAAKATPKPAGPGAIAAGGGLDSVDKSEKGEDKPEDPESYSATGIDNALDLLEVVTAKMDKASVGQRAAGIEQHPEVCACYLH